MLGGAHQHGYGLRPVTPKVGFIVAAIRQQTHSTSAIPLASTTINAIGYLRATETINVPGQGLQTITGLSASHSGLTYVFITTFTPNATMRDRADLAASVGSIVLT